MTWETIRQLAVSRYCAVRVLSEEPDFAEQKEWTEEVVKLGYSVIFYPNITASSTYRKSHHRSNCSNNFRDLSEGLPQTIKTGIPLAFIRRAGTQIHELVSARCGG